MGLKDNSRYDVSKFKKVEKTYVTQEQLLKNHDEVIQTEEFKKKIDEERVEWNNIRERIHYAYLLAGNVIQIMVSSSMIGHAKIGTAKIR